MIYWLFCIEVTWETVDARWAFRSSFLFLKAGDKLPCGRCPFCTRRKEDVLITKDTELRQKEICTHRPCSNNSYLPLASLYCLVTFHMEKEMAIHSDILAWRIPWTEEPGGLRSMRSQSRRWLKQLSTHTRHAMALAWCHQFNYLTTGGTRVWNTCSRYIKLWKSSS